jgi:uncharacterized membrane protein
MLSAQTGLLCYLIAKVDMEAIQPILGSAAVMLAIDVVWLYNRNAYHQQLFKNIQGEPIDPRLFPAAAIYIILPIAIYMWAVQDAKTLYAAARNGFIVGFLMYAFYDLTNYATFKNWPLQMTMIDILWGSFLCTVGAAAGYYLKPK